MKSRIVGEIGIFLVISIVLVAALEVQPANALGTISILSDGSVSPSNSPIQRNGNLYTLTSNISCSSDGIHIGKDNIVIDGAGYFLQGSGGSGLLLVGRNNVTIRNMGIVGFYQGIMLTWDDTTIFGSTQCSIIGNNMKNNNYGIFLYRSSNNKIAGNTIADNTQSAILLIDGSNGNLVLQNNVTNNAAGILDDSQKPMTGCASNNITTNVITGNGDAISFQGYGNSISYNDIVQNNGVGISFGSAAGSGSSSNTVFNNHIENNRGDSIYFYGCSNNNVTNNDIISNGNGITFDAYWYYADFIPSNNFVSGNNIIGNNGDGVRFVGSQKSTISQNKINSNSANGAYFDRYLSAESNTYIYCSNNTVYGNTLAQNLGYGIRQADPLTDHGGYPETDNKYFHNNFVSNQAGPAYTPYWEASVDSWDNGYPSGGNYWNDFANLDIYSGPSQNLPGSDGIWDQMRMLDEGTWDHYPLVNPWVPVEGLVVRGVDNRIYYRAWNGTEWEGWKVLPGSTIDSPAAAVLGNQLQLVVRGSDGHSLWYGHLTNIADPGSFSGWTLLSGATSSAPTLTSNGTALCLVVRGLDNRIYYRVYDTQAQAWQGWNALPNGATCDKPAAAMLGGTLSIIVRGYSPTNAAANSTLWYSTVNLMNNAFSGWTMLSGATPSSPTLTATQTSNSLYLTVRGNDNRVYVNTWNGGNWQGWNALPTGSTDGTPAATIMGDNLYFVVIGMDGKSMWQNSLDLSTNSYSGWTLLDGSTPSAPTLTS